MNNIVRLGVIIAAALSAIPAYASDFTFNVPVRIENMHNATQAWVNCAVYQGSSYSRRSVGSGRSEIVLHDGAYTGTVPVNIDVYSGYTPNDVTDWGCGLVYLWHMPDGSTFNRSTSTSDERNSLYTRYTGQEVGSFHMEEGGSISR